MNQREINSMTALKHVLDAYYDLPLSIRAEIDEKMNPALGKCDKALREYSTDVRAEIVEAVKESNINRRFKKVA